MSSDKDALPWLCIPGSPALVFSTREWGWMGVGKQATGRGLDGEQREGGGVCVAWLMWNSNTQKNRSLKVARLQATQMPSLLESPWLGC